MSQETARKTVQVASLPNEAVERVRREAVDNGALDSDGSAVRFGFMQYYQSLARRDRQECAAPEPPPPVAKAPQAAAPA